MNLRSVRLRSAALWLGLAVFTAIPLGAEETVDGSDVAELLKKAGAGDAAAQLEVAEHFLRNTTGESDDAPARDFKLVEKWLQAAALKGSAPAARMLGELLYHEYPGVPVNRPRAMAAFQKGAQGGDVQAMLMLAGVLTSGAEDVKPDPAKAEAWMKKAAETAPEGSPERDQAERMIQQLAERREAEAERAELAKQADAQKSASPLTAAAPKSGPDAAALYQQALALGRGEGVERDLEKAAEALLAAAAQGHADAQKKLRMFDFYPGMGRLAVMARINSKEGLAELTTAAEKGDAEAQFALGIHSLISDPVVKAGWFARAAAQRHRVAMSWLGRAYELGEGVPLDRVKSLAWYAQAALLGDNGAKAKLAEFYHWGYAGLKSPALAKYWNQQAALGATPEDSTAKYAADAASRIGEPAADAAYALKLLRQAAAGAVFPDGKAQVASNPAPSPTAVPSAPAKRTPEELRSAAEKGDAEAMYQLGRSDVDRRQEESNRSTGPSYPDPQRNANDFRWIMAAARAGHPSAQFLAATHWLSAETDAAKKTWLEKAAAQNHEEAKSRFAALTKAETAAAAQAVDDAKKAAADRELAAQGDPDAAFRLFRQRVAEITKTIVADFTAEQKSQPTSGKNYQLGYLDADMITWGDLLTQRLHVDGLVMLHDYLRDARPDFAYRALLLRERIAKIDLRLALPDGGYGTKSRAGFEKALAYLRGKLTAEQLTQTEKRTADQFGGPGTDNNIGANFELGVAGYPQDHGLALAHYRRAAEAGFAWGQTNLARCYQLGLGTAKDLDQARAWYVKSAAQGNATARDQLQAMDTFTAMVRIKSLSAEERANLTELDWAQAEFQFLNGEQRERLHSADPALAISLGLNYRDGANGFVQDYGRAYHWFSEAVEKGSATGHLEIGNILFRGQGRPIDKPGAFAQYLRAAELGHPVGQLNAGYCYLQGEGVARSPLAGHDWIAKAAAQGNTSAQTLLGNITKDPGLQLLLAQRNEQQALRGAQQGVAAALSNSPAAAPAADPLKDNPILQQGALATKALQGDKAALAQLNAQQQNLKTQRDLIDGTAPTAAPAQPTAAVDLQRLFVDATYAFVNGKTIEGRKSNGLDLWEKAAALGHVDSALRLAEIYRTGERGTKKSLEKSRDWLRKAAAAGDSYAVEQLREFEREMTGGRWEFELGQEAFRNEETAQAVALFEKSASLGYGAAMVRLGHMYREGFGAKRDWAKARAWFQKAAEAKSADGMLQLAFAYRDAIGGAPDIALARKWFEQAALAATEQDDAKTAADGLASLSGQTAESANTLGLSAFAGKDFAQAIEWFQKASAMGSALASANLAEMYVHGEGVKADKTEALRWYEKAVAQGHGPAKNFVRDLRAELKLPPDAALGEAPKSITDALLSHVAPPAVAAAPRNEPKSAEEEILNNIMVDSSNGKVTTGTLGIPPAPPSPALTPEQEVLKTKALTARATAADWFALGVSLCPPPPTNPQRRGLKEAFPWFLKAAEAGHEPSQFFVTMAYRDGFPGTPPDEAATARWLEKLGAPTGPRPMRLQFAQAHEAGLLGVRRDRDRAGQIYAQLAAEKFEPGVAEWKRFQRETAANPLPAPAGETPQSRLAAAVAGNADAAVRHYLANDYTISGDAPVETALGKALAAGSAAGNQAARAVMAWIWIEQRIGDEQVPEQIAQLRIAVDHGVAEAAYRYGLCLWDGVESIDEPGKMLLAQDRKSAALFFDSAAKRGHPRAHEAIGRAYATGDGVGKSESMARRHFRAAAALGVASAHVQVGHSALRESDATRARIAAENRAPNADEQPLLDALQAEALRYFESGAKAKDAEAQVVLARILDAGQLVRADRPRAVQLLVAASQAGSKLAHRELADAFTKGGLYGVQRDLARAGQHLAQLLELGDADAGVQLGRLYRGTDGHVRDTTLGYQSLALAVDLGAKATSERDAAAKALTAAERARADQRVEQMRTSMRSKGVRFVDPRPAPAPASAVPPPTAPRAATSAPPTGVALDNLRKNADFIKGQLVRLDKTVYQIPEYIPVFDLKAEVTLKRMVARWTQPTGGAGMWLFHAEVEKPAPGKRELKITVAELARRLEVGASDNLVVEVTHCPACYNKDPRWAPHGEVAHSNCKECADTGCVPTKIKILHMKPGK